MAEPRRVRETSLEALRYVRETGCLNREQQRVYEHLFEHGPTTGIALAAAFGDSTGSGSTAVKRLSELEDRGLAVVVGQEAYEDGLGRRRRRQLWDVTGNLPADLARAPSSRQAACCPTCGQRGRTFESRRRIRTARASLPRRGGTAAAAKNEQQLFPEPGAPRG